jgi:hypothetical protein
MKQETLHEVALEFAKDFHEMYETSNLGSMHFGFIEGAKWQQEQDKKMYSEEDMKFAYEQGARLALISQSPLALHKGEFPTPKEWFEQFKNK